MNTVTLELKDYEELLKFKEAVKGGMILTETLYSTYGSPIQQKHSYLIDKDKFIKELNEENENNKFKLASFSRAIEDEKFRLSRIESKWWYKLFNKHSK